jgi:TonB family protein
VAAPLAFFILIGATAAEPPTRAVPNQSLPSLISNDDYPAEAVRRNEQGTVAFRLDIGVDGRVSGCSIHESSGSAILDASTCRILRARARFRPALDAQGRPTPDQFVSTLRWVLGNPAPPHLRVATVLWQSCVFGEAAKLTVGDLSAEEVADLAFQPCAALEALVERQVGAAALTGPRREWTNNILAQLPAMRQTLKQAPQVSRPVR